MKRFYKAVAVEPAAAGWRVTLDGRGIKTVAGSPQIVPTAALAEALAAEWAGQADQIDPARFPHRDLADYAIDVVGADRAAVERAALAFAETDTLCYRADPDKPLWKRQLEVWEPLLAESEQRWGIGFTRVSGIIHRPQPPTTLARLAEMLAALDPFALAALHTLASLAGSLVLGFTALEPEAEVEALWNAANLEEDWQAELWGADTEALARKGGRGEIFAVAARMAALTSYPAN